MIADSTGGAHGSIVLKYQHQYDTGLRKRTPKSSIYSFTKDGICPSPQGLAWPLPMPGSFLARCGLVAKGQEGSTGKVGREVARLRPESQPRMQAMTTPLSFPPPAPTPAPKPRSQGACRCGQPVRRNSRASVSQAPGWTQIMRPPKTNDLGTPVREGRGYHQLPHCTGGPVACLFTKNMPSPSGYLSLEHLPSSKLHCPLGGDPRGRPCLLPSFKRKSFAAAEVRA